MLVLHRYCTRIGIWQRRQQHHSLALVAQQCSAALAPCCKAEGAARCHADSASEAIYRAHAHACMCCYAGAHRARDQPCSPAAA